MKIKNIVTVFLVGTILTSCAPAATVVPTETAMPTSTFTPIPPTPTITPTLAPENLIDAKDLSKWVNNFVHAFGGKVTVDSVDMDANQLAEEIHKNAETFTLIKEINGVEYLFLMVNGFPLAMREGKGQWEELTSRKILGLGRKPSDTFKYFGVQFSNPFFNNTSAEVDEVFSREFNMAFLNDGYWHAVEQSEGHPDFRNLIDAADKARAKDMFVLGGQLVDPRGEFDYTYLKNKQGLTGDLLLAIMKRHITDQMTATKGKVDAYVVVNESRPASARIDGRPEDPFNVIIGEDYIREAFQTARDTDPQAILIYNDGANHQPSGNGGYNTQRTLEIIKRLNPEGQGKGLIDVVGVQLHINAAKPPNINNITKTIEKYGLPVYVTELEINVERVNGSPGQKIQIQSDLYKKILIALLKSDSVVMISQWSAISDSETTGRLFDDQLNPTINLFIERQVLFEHFLGNQ